MKENLIDVVIPVYNSAKNLIRGVESLLFGEFRDIRIILVDDCSTDNSWDVCQWLSEKYDNVDSFHNDSNMGVSFTRNLGIKQATSKYLMFMDSDDFCSSKTE